MYIRKVGRKLHEHKNGCLGQKEREGAGMMKNDALVKTQKWWKKKMSQLGLDSGNSPDERRRPDKKED